MILANKSDEATKMSLQPQKSKHNELILWARLERLSTNEYGKGNVSVDKQLRQLCSENIFDVRKNRLSHRTLANKATFYRQYRHYIRIYHTNTLTVTNTIFMWTPLTVGPAAKDLLNLSVGC